MGRLGGCYHRVKTWEYSNGLLSPEMDSEGHVSCVYGLLDPASGRLQLANAGFNTPILSHGGDDSTPHSPGMPLGVKLDVRYGSRIVRYSFIPGSSSCYTATD